MAPMRAMKAIKSKKAGTKAMRKETVLNVTAAEHGLNEVDCPNVSSPDCTSIGEKFESAGFADSTNTGASFDRPRRFFVGANWKCCLESVAEVDQLVADMNTFWRKEGSQLTDIELCAFPPYVFLDRVRRQMHPEIRIGGQNAWESAPSFKSTGVVSASMLQNVGCQWVLLGHSDRRNTLGESDSLIHDKVGMCLSAGLSVNLTIGETLQAREAGNAIATLIGQLSAATVDVPSDAWSRIAISYEPVWAIGEGAIPCSPEETQRVLAALRAWIKAHAGRDNAQACRLIYTGSVNEKNAEQYARLPDVDGFVVGRAGLDIAKLAAICTKLCNAKQDGVVMGA